MKIQISNKSTVVGPAEFLAGATACADQLRNEFCSAWEFVPPEIETTLEKRVEWSLGTVSMTARIEYRSQVDAVSAARVQLGDLVKPSQVLGTVFDPI